MNVIKPPSGIASYLKIARFDHWFKNVFMIPGMIIAIFAQPSLLTPVIFVDIILAFLATGFVASSNYVINELLDAPFDALHPVKKNRPIPSGNMNKRFVIFEWIFFAVIGLSLATRLGMPFFLTALILWIMGCIYNIPPLRSKDKPYVDVLSESVNNPLRLLLGWYSIGIAVFPPISLILAYWMVGAFFMAVKRFAEYRRIGDPSISAKYRQSFKHYNEPRLLVCIVYYAVSFGLFFGIFLMRYRMELIMAIPVIAGFIAWYIQLGLLENSPAQYPEMLYKQRGFTLYCFFCVLCFHLLLFIDLPFLYTLFESTIQ
jgi:4-hydroxybenzoate polyprenyltransferase